MSPFELMHIDLQEEQKCIALDSCPIDAAFECYAKIKTHKITSRYRALQTYIRSATRIKFDKIIKIVKYIEPELTERVSRYVLPLSQSHIL